MHLLEKYSLNCGINPLKLNRAEIFSSYYPLPFEKYIVFHTGSDCAAKNYSYYQEVIDFTYENLTENGYGLVQIGGPEDKVLNGCFNLNGKTNIFQTCFILKNAKLLICNDNFSMQVCSSYFVPLISLFSTSHPEVNGPFWKNQKQMTIMAPLYDNKPSYSTENDPDRIVDNIKPEEIIKKIKSIIPELTPSKSLIPETLFIGKEYKDQKIDIVPDSSKKIAIENNKIVNIRFDLLKEEANQDNFLSSIMNTENRKFFITLNKRLDIFKAVDPQNAKNLLSFILNINSSNFETIDELKILVQEIKEKGAPLRVFYDGEDLSEKQIAKLKFDFLDIVPVFEKPFDKRQESLFLEALAKSNSLTLFKSSYMLFSSGKVFSSEESYKQNIHSENAIQKLNSFTNLLKDCSNLYLFNLNGKNQ